MPPRKSAKKSPADAVDTQLSRYREMRHFDITAEPSGSSTAPKPTQLPFVIQKHAASHLHYDFRLGWNGVLKSWAVAKGPSYVVKDRRLAVQVEDHPMEYGGFEGIIPRGQYGGGTVMVWDQGTWNPQPGHEDVDAGLHDGSLKFELHGTKLEGKWTLIRMNTKPGAKGGRWGNSTKPNWLLIKEHDDHERGPDDPCITEEKPNSAVTGRTLEQIAAQEDHIWNSKETAGPGQAWHRTTTHKSPPTKPKPTPEASAEGASHNSLGRSPRLAAKTVAKGLKARGKKATANLPKEPQPDFIPPQLALEATTPPAGTNYLHELKLDGYRIQARKQGAKVQLLTRKGLDWTHRMSTIAAALKTVPAKDATLDGEVVVLLENGTTSFANLQASFQNGDKHELTYFAFDLLHLNGGNTRNLPLRDRKALLAGLLPDPEAPIRYSEHLDTGGEAMFHHACELHAEGIISKRADAPYCSGRTQDWLKSKCLREQEFVIAGFSDSTEGAGRIGSLLLAYNEAGKLIYAGRTGTGFTQKLKRDLYKQLLADEIKTPTATRVPAEARRGAHWVTPKLVAQVRFATWTADNLVRQAAFLGLREDKSPSEVTREAPTVAPRPKAEKAGNSASISAASKTASKIASKTTSRTALKGTGFSPSIDTPQKSAALAPEGKAQQSTRRLTHPDKIVDPETNLTKRELAAYYEAVAERMLPHIADRPLSLVRCPEGAGKPCFFQKHVNAMLPPGIGSIEVPDKKTGKPEPYITLNTAASIAGLAQMGVLEVHPWSSRNQDLEHPDRLIFDLDPDESIPWPTVCAAAAEVRQRLKKLGLESFLKTTGGKGLHIVAPILPEHAFAEVKEAAHKFVLAMERANPRLYLTKMSKAARANKIYLDYLRNERGATAVAPYSPRARLGIGVSLPLPWSSLELPTRPNFSVRNFPDWSSHLRTDPWKAMPGLRQSLKISPI